MKTVFFAAAALLATTLLTQPVAAADPAACDNFKFEGIMNIVEDPGQTIAVSFTPPDGMSGRAYTRDGYQSMNTDFGFIDGYANNGVVNGGITGRHVAFTISWNDGPLDGFTDQFYGQVRDDLSVSGNMASRGGQSRRPLAHADR